MSTTSPDSAGFVRLNCCRCTLSLLLRLAVVACAVSSWCFVSNFVFSCTSCCFSQTPRHAHLQQVLGNDRCHVVVLTDMSSDFNTMHFVKSSSLSLLCCLFCSHLKAVLPNSFFFSNTFTGLVDLHTETT